MLLHHRYNTTFLDYLVPFPGKLGPGKPVRIDKGACFRVRYAIIFYHTISQALTPLAHASSHPTHTQGLTPYQIASFRAMHHAENQATHFGSLRGGKLSDVHLHARASSSGPIRGNVTVPTMLSIIANTAGMKPVTPKAFFDIESIDRHWTNMLLDPNRQDEILKLIEPFRWYGDNDRSKDWRHPASPRYDELARYISLNADRFPTLASFEQYVLSQVKSDSTLHERHTFRRKIVQLKIQLDRGDNFNCTRDQKERILFERYLIPSGATLVIVPDNAHLDHWVDHIRSRHPNLEVILDCKHLRNVTEMLKCSEDKGVVFAEYEENIHRRAWEDTFPSVYNIERCTIVLVTYARIRRDSNLLEQVRWFRIVVDEGQAELGKYICRRLVGIVSCCSLTQFIFHFLLFKVYCPFRY